VAPGFIDMMGLGDHAPDRQPGVLEITQGITTEVTGEGGSVAPLTALIVLTTRMP